MSLLNAPGRIGLMYGGTDKVEHGYMAFYRQHLRRTRFRRNVVFEIGVGGVPSEGNSTGYDKPLPGGSLAVWRDYLPRSTLVGIDLHHKDVNLGPSVHFVQADQSDAEAILRVVDRFGPPDLVIDDGSHIASDITATFRVLWPVLRPGGLYVVEDLSTSYYPNYGGGPAPSSDTAVGLAQELVDSVQALDSTFQRWPLLGQRPPPAHAHVRAVHVYPGIVFVEKDHST